MTTKLTLTITPDEEFLAPDQIDAAMARTIASLVQLGRVPTRKIVLTIACADDDAEMHEDTIDAALSSRPMGIEVVLKTTKERHVARESRLTSVTPMDKVGWGPAAPASSDKTPGARAVDWLETRERN